MSTYMTSQINESPIIFENAGAAITDVRGLILKYDASGNVVPATAGVPAIGVGIITNNSAITAGDAVDIQVKDIGLVKAGAAFAKGAKLASDANGKAVTATGTDAVIGIALQACTAADSLNYIQINKYEPGAAGDDGVGVASIALTVVEGAVTAGTWTDTDGTSHDITIS